MPVTDHQVATLHTFLAQDFEEHERFRAQLDREADRAGYNALIAAGFFEAVDRRFAAEGTVADVIGFVANLRSRSDRLAADLDPRVAERLIRHSLGDGSITDIDDQTVIGTQFLVLAGLIADEQLDEAGLGKFMSGIRELADEWVRRAAGSTG